MRLLLLSTMGVIVCLILISCSLQSNPTVTNTNMDTNGNIHLTVLVTGDGRPLSDIRVEFYEDQFKPIPGELIATGMTDESGRAEFSLKAGSYGVWLRSLSMDNQWRYEGPTKFELIQDQELALTMEPAY